MYFQNIDYYYFYICALYARLRINAIASGAMLDLHDPFRYRDEKEEKIRFGRNVHAYKGVIIFPWKTMQRSRARSCDRKKIRT